MVPPLFLFHRSRPLALLNRVLSRTSLLAQAGGHATAGGRVVFGTDVGFVPDDDPTREYELLADAWLSFAQILASLTAAPADLFGESRTRGRVAAGQAADLVVLLAVALRRRARRKETT
jgi:imidazolonepropionase-like amidohydrolase